MVEGQTANRSKTSSCLTFNHSLIPKLNRSTGVDLVDELVYIAKQLLGFVFGFANHFLPLNGEVGGGRR